MMERYLHEAGVAPGEERVRACSLGGAAHGQEAILNSFFPLLDIMVHKYGRAPVDSWTRGNNINKREKAKKERRRDSVYIYRSHWGVCIWTFSGEMRDDFSLHRWENCSSPTVMGLLFAIAFDQDMYLYSI